MNVGQLDAGRDSCLMDARTEVRSRVDQPGEHRVRLTEELARFGIGDRG